MKHTYTLHPWHGITPGKKAPEIVEAYIEIPAHSQIKYELDSDSGLLRVDRMLFSAVHYPQNYGFIPQTLDYDGDPLDILVVMHEPVTPGCLIQARVLGVMHMIDQGKIDDKIVAVCVGDPTYSNVHEISDLPPYTTEAIIRFFKDYKLLEKKTTQIEDKIGTREAAYEVIKNTMKLYQEKYPSTK